MSLFLALHTIAAQRGDGLRPELVALLQRRGRSEGDRFHPVSQDSGLAGLSFWPDEELALSNRTATKP
jgi:hypothetical protein